MNEVRSILFAEDNPHDVELTLAALAEYNIANEIIVVRDGAEALDYLYRRGRFQTRAATHPVVVLLDLKMPKVDGLEVLRIIKQDEMLRKIPVVMLTSSREEQDLARSYQLGVNSYVLKPVGFQAFAEAVKTLGVYWVVHNQPPPDGAPPVS
jgi:CheY-like chemotaxis protein